MQRFPILNQIGIVPRWTIFICDLTVSSIAFIFAYTLFYSFNLNAYDRPSFGLEFIYCLSITAISFSVFRLYSGIVRYTSAVDSIRILSTILFNLILFFILKVVSFAFNIPSLLPTNLIIIYSLFTFTGLTTYRTLIKIFFQYSKSIGPDKQNVVVYGAGDLGIAVKRTFDHDVKSNKFIIAYIDDDDNKIGKSIDGVKIFSSSNFDKLIDKMQIDELIFASHNINTENKDKIVEACLEHQINVLTLPPVNEIINGNLSPNQIKKIRIEDLLERLPIQLPFENISEQLTGKRILVTGAAGSIGSEIVRQLSKFNPQLIILCDQAESPLHTLQLDMQDQFKNQLYHAFIADVKNEERMRILFESLRPQYVYHAAAYKHVPMMENHPVEGVLTNVKGTYTVANLAVEFEVSKFVFVSTDKAVNPTNVMGATKRIAEIYVQALNHHLSQKSSQQKTRFVTTRFGNVLGSNGSVIPRFREQIEKGGPVTVTHPEITRYFMTIPEACQLVIEAGCMGNGGEIYVFDMGKSVKIVDLAEKMIKLSGLTPYRDIDIKFTGLRPGEKLYEELLNDLENTVPTHHKKIMIARVRQNDFDMVNQQIQALLNSTKAHDSMEMVRQMKCMVAEFKSQNSIYEQLDKELSPRVN